MIHNPDNFLTTQQMFDRYQELKASGDIDKLYLIDLQSVTGQQIIFCGSRHSNIPSDVQYQEMQVIWKKFLESKNEKKIVVCEGGVRPVENMSLHDAIISHGDPGFASWLAFNNNIKLSSPEPSDKAEIEGLLEHFSSHKTILYYFARQMYQWARGDFISNPNWQIYISNTLERYKPYFHDISIDLDNVLKIFESEFGKPFSFYDSEILYKLSCPHPNSVSEATGKLRDKHIFMKIQEYWNSGFDIFIVYGSGHAIILEPALKKLLRDSN